MQLYRRLLKLLPCILLAGLFSAPAWAAESPVQHVENITDELLVKLKEIQPLYESDQEAFFTEVDASLAPHIDFVGFSRGVMAKHYRQASEEQRDQFTQTFRKALIRTYSTALVEFDNQKIVVKEPKKPQRRPDRATVDLEIHTGGGAVFPVEYSLVLDGDAWKLRNVVINGINIGLQFKSQFSSYMQQYRGDIDEVIANWSVSAET